MITDERMIDLLRYARQYLHDEGLISSQEYADLCNDHGPERVARLHTYDKLRAELAEANTRAAFFEEECRKRAGLLEELGSGPCAYCDGEFFLNRGVIHAQDCRLAPLTTMPTPPEANV